ncbi:MAG: hypothetical protein V3V09_05315 [Arenicellales bacterium]
MLGISALELWILSKLTFPLSSLFYTALASLVLTRFIVYPWSLIGLFRSAENNFVQRGGALTLRAIQLLGLVSIVLTLVYGLAVIQGALAREHVVSPMQPVSQTYRLNLQKNNTQLSIEGDFELGITEEVGVLVKNNPSLNTVILHSQGGQIYEGRGLARIFIEKGLDTLVVKKCSSACTTAFLGGKLRALGTQAKLGFHQYKLSSEYSLPLLAYFDIKAEQQRDLTLFASRGISQSFLDQIFTTSADQLWFPDHVQLLKAGVIHEIVH